MFGAVAISGFLVLLFVGSRLTNPFSRLTIVRRPFIVQVVASTWQTIDHNRRLKVRQGVLWRAFALLKSGWYVIESRYLHSPRSGGTVLRLGFVSIAAGNTG